VDAGYEIMGIDKLGVSFRFFLTPERQFHRSCYNGGVPLGMGRPLNALPPQRRETAQAASDPDPDLDPDPLA